MQEGDTIHTSYQKLSFGSGDYPDKLLYPQALNEVSNSSDRELPRDMFRFKTVWNYVGSIDRELPRDMFRFKTVWNYLGSMDWSILPR